MDAVRRIADAVLYEGYLLWPYRRSALKNQQRWTFGGVHPETSGESSEMQSECLLDGGDESRVELRVRFLHIVRRQLFRGAEPVDELAGRLSWDEAVERELAAGPLRLGEKLELPIEIAGGERREDVEGGEIVRRWRELRGTMLLESSTLGGGLWRVCARVRNTSPWAGGTREEAQRQAFCSTHFVLDAHGAEFRSLTDAPADLRERCRNVGCWPVLVGEEGDRGTVLCSPIILSDYPQIAPESPGDLFDGGEIDQLLTLNILALTDEEKREMRASDPRAREILDRTEALTDDELMRLHGAIREFGMVRRP